MKIEIKRVILVLLTSVSVRAITHCVRSESSRTVEKQTTEIRWKEESGEDRDAFKGQRGKEMGEDRDAFKGERGKEMGEDRDAFKGQRGKEMGEDRDAFKGQREIATVSPTTTSAVELVDAKETVTDKTPNPIVVAYFVANLGEKTKDAVFDGLPGHPRTGYHYANGYGNYGVQSAFDGHLAVNKPYTGYRHAPSGYGYGFGGYGYSTQDGYPVLGSLARKLRRLKDYLHFWRGFNKRLL